MELTVQELQQIINDLAVEKAQLELQVRTLTAVLNRTTDEGCAESES